MVQVNTDYPAPQFFNVPFAAANFGATGSMTWTVDSGDVVTFTYAIFGSMMWIWLRLATTTVGGTVAGQQLTIKLPNGVLAAKTVSMPATAGPNGGATESVLVASVAGSNLLVMARYAADWAAGANNTSIDFAIAVQIQ